jgi:uncharacterized membrane protein YgcG
MNDLTSTSRRGLRAAAFVALALGALTSLPACFDLDFGKGGTTTTFDLNTCHSDDDCGPAQICAGLFLNCQAASTCHSDADCAPHETCMLRWQFFSGTPTHETCESVSTPPPDTSSTSSTGGTGAGGTGGAGGGPSVGGAGGGPVADGGVDAGP